MSIETARGALRVFVQTAGILGTSLALAGNLHAQFALAVTPPRFEINVEPGQTARRIVEISHELADAGTYRVYTADWTMDATGALTFFETLQPGSCRPWVAIERREVTVAVGSRLRYRFEVAAAADAISQECRFALMIETQPRHVAATDMATLQVHGRIGVVVYVSVSKAKAVLEPGAVSVGSFDGRPAPVLLVHNSGNATGRLSGIVKGTDAAGVTIEFRPEAVPILPGQTRQIALQPHEATRTAHSGWHWPLSLRGSLEYGTAGATRVELDRTVTEGTAE